MPNDYKNIEDLFKEASSQAAGPPPPPPDWGGMSAMLKESALIKTGAGAGAGATGAGGAAKAGLAKVLGAKLLVNAVVATTVTVGAVTAVYVAVDDNDATISIEESTTASEDLETASFEDETATQEAINPADATLAADESPLDPTQSNALKAVDATNTAGLGGNSTKPNQAMKTTSEGLTEASNAEPITRGSMTQATDASVEKNEDEATDADENQTNSFASGSEADIAATATEANSSSFGDASSEASENTVGNNGSDATLVTDTDLVTTAPDATPPALRMEDPSAVENNSGGNNEPPLDSPFDEEELANNASASAAQIDATTQDFGTTSDPEEAPIYLIPLDDTPTQNTLENKIVSNTNSRFTLEQMPLLSLSGSDTSSTLALHGSDEFDFVPSAKPKWIISPYFSFDRSSYNVDQLELQNLTNSKYDVELNSSKLHYTVGLRGAYSFFPNLWLESGLLFSQKSTITGNIELSDDDGNLVGIAEYDLSGQFLEIPIALVLRKNNSSFGWYAKAGVHLSYNFPSNAGSYIYRDLTTERQYIVEPSIKTLNPAVAFGAGIEYNLTPKLRAYVEPSFRYSLRPVLNVDGFGNIPLNPKWNSFGLGVGINYYFGKNGKE